MFCENFRDVFGLLLLFAFVFLLFVFAFRGRRGGGVGLSGCRCVRLVGKGGKEFGDVVFDCFWVVV